MCDIDTMTDKQAYSNLQESMPPDAPLSDSDTSEPGNVAENLVCDGWGPAAFKKNHGLSNLKKHMDIKMVRRNFDVEELMRDMASASEDQEAFFVVDLTTVLAKLSSWKQLMPRVKPFYAVKCNNDAAICRLLALSGCGFDCASQAEIEQVMEMGVPVDQIIYANPCKQASMLRFARDSNVRLMTDRKSVV